VTPTVCGYQFRSRRVFFITSSEWDQDARTLLAVTTPGGGVRFDHGDDTILPYCPAKRGL
jgi:hypothetical protein